MKNYFLSYTTLPFGPKRFVHFKGPKNVLCHGLTQRQEIQIFHMNCQRHFSSAEVRGIFRFLFTNFFFVLDFRHFLFLIICQFSPQCLIYLLAEVNIIFRNERQTSKMPHFFQLFSKIGSLIRIEDLLQKYLTRYA